MSMALVNRDTGEFIPVGSRLAPEELKRQAEDIKELMKAVLEEGVDFGRIPNTPKPTLFKPGAERLLMWARLGSSLEPVQIERDDRGQKYGATYRCTIHLLNDRSQIVSTCDGYCGYDEADREEHTSRNGKRIPRSPWNTIIKMAQKRAMVGATLQATASSGLFTQDVEDLGPAAAAADEPVDPDVWFKDNGWSGGKEQHDRFRKACIDALSAAPPEIQSKFKAWRETEELHGFGSPHTKKEAERLSAMVTEMTSKQVEAEAPAAEAVEEAEVVEDQQPASAAPPGILAHALHDWEKKGRCVYCKECGDRLYQGALPKSPDEQVAVVQQMVEAEEAAARAVEQAEQATSG